MKTQCRQTTKLSRLLLSAALLSCLFGVAPTNAATTAEGNKAGSDRPDCSYGPAHNGSGGCMSRSEFVLTRSRQALLDADPAQYQRNALVRCERLTGDDRKDCVARMDGQGNRTGTVEGGGMYRELVTIVPGVVAPVRRTP